MTRLRHWYILFCLVALGICGPVALTTWLSREFAEQLFQRRVDQFTERALQRIDVVSRDAVNAARAADTFSGPPCSLAHLDAMREADLQHRYARQVVYLDHEQLLCSSSSIPGALRSVEGQTAPWTALPELGAAYRIDTSAGPPRTVQFRVGRHVVVVDAQFFIDIVPLDDLIRLGMVDAATGHVVVNWPGTDTALVRSAWKRKQDGEVLGGRYVDVKASHLLPFGVVAYEPLSEVAAMWRRLLYLSLPIGLLVSVLATWLVLRWGRRLRGPRYALQDAIRRKEFYAEYQPIMSLDDGRCIGAEALVRWRLPDGTIVPPDNFIPMAETTGDIHAITNCMIEVVMRDLGAHLAANRAMHVSINLSADDFRARDTLHTITAARNAAGIDASQIWIEVTERGLANDAECRATIAAFREAGFPILIDDFGTGYSSLAYLHDLHVDGLKIDRAFVASMTTGAPSKAVGPHIIEMAKALDIRMVAEGIETESQWRIMREHGVQAGQGWLFGKAMPLADFLAFWRYRARPHESADTRSAA
ncbi:EAL domain-containing protein [Cupriavidus pauculus]|uniref:EAL domain-containing protein n=1 Tax=Cupriavidus pauculus TaxID=82633 RepID=UPI000781A139|nr:EAL domain-containing protein [Cupriavidus pauculus]MBY4730421.1 EAL domain-containing protein [Cupriavidus pauculus]